MSQPESQPATSKSPGLLTALENLQARQQAAYFILGLGLTCLVLLCVIIVRQGWPDSKATPLRLYLVEMTVLLSVVGLWMKLDNGSSGTKPADSLRLQALILGGGIGFFTAKLGMLLAIMTYSQIFTGGLVVWRANAGRVFLCVLLFVGGLSLMFLTLLLGRTMERTSATVRRVVYGFNAVLTGLLLVTILGLLNVLCYVPWGPFRLMNTPWDWTASRIYSLSPTTTNFLVDLEKPVTVYVLISPRHPVGQDMETLLSNIKNVTSKVTWQTLSRDLNRNDVQQLFDKYQIAESGGLLVVYGTAPSEQTEFIRMEDLFADNSARDRQGNVQKGSYVFKGEGALMKALTYLAQDKKKAVVYFTQGNGEPTLSGGPAESRFSQSVAQISERLSKANYEVKPLELKPGVDKVPPDADVVVVANPRLGLPDTAIKGLKDYMMPSGAGKKGKMIVLSDVVLTSDRKKMATSGMELLLRQFDVALGEERLLSPKANPAEILAIPNVRSRNPIAQAFYSDGQVSLFRFEDARSVEKAGPEGAPPGRSSYKVEDLLVTLPRMPVWRETNFSDPVALVESMITPDREDELRKKFSPKPLSVAVTVAETDQSVPQDMAHRGVSGKDEVPRMVVFGDATWITDNALAGNYGKVNSELFVSSVGWLKGRADLGKSSGDTDKTREEFTLAGNVTPDVVTRIRYLPMGLMVLGIFGLGGGIWLIRRR